jgi:hypothetical protein
MCWHFVRGVKSQSCRHCCGDFIPCNKYFPVDDSYLLDSLSF